jgi:transcriptional regulator with XRE-family HTH domain
MAKVKTRSFGQVIRDRRRQLDLTQEEVARRISTSTPYIGHLESGKRHPSEKVVTKLADVLGLDRRETFFLANPGAKALLSQQVQSNNAASAWDEFRKDERLRRIHNITGEEMEMLSHVALMGDVRSSRDFVYILNTIRQALGR